jgi:hypothetical protein
VRGLISVVLIRSLVAFLALEVADTPIFCADERTEATTNACSLEVAPSGGLLASFSSIADDGRTCFCPCHLAFESEATHSHAAQTELSAVNPVAHPRTPPESPQELDHPPQNLG